MEFPEQLILKFISKQDKTPIRNHAVGLMVKAKKKNDYSVGPKCTNNDGVAVFTPEDIKEAIDCSMKMFIMDYASFYEECSSTFEVWLMSKKAVKENLKWLKEHLRFFGDLIKTSMISEFEKAENQGENGENWIVTPEMWKKIETDSPTLVFECE